MCETKSMRKTIVAAVATMFFCAGTIGCQTAAKMAWWKTADATNVESTALAHSAPALPADLAKQAESLATTAPSIQMSGGEAAPYSTAPTFSPAATSVAATPATAPGAGLTGSVSKTASTAHPSTAYPSTPYPSTGASPYTASAAATVATNSPATPPAYAAADQSADLGSVDMPYNPNAVPPARTVATASPRTPSATTDRYGMASTAAAFSGANAQPVTTPALPQLSGAGRYAKTQSDPVVQNDPVMQSNSVATVSPVATAAGSPKVGVDLAAASASPESMNTAPTFVAATNPASTNPVPAASVNITGSRYATSNSQASIAPSGATPTQAAALAAKASPYRPGGTASYQGSATGASAVEIASRPNSVQPEVPNVAIPGSTPEPSQAPRYR